MQLTESVLSVGELPAYPKRRGPSTTVDDRQVLLHVYDLDKVISLKSG